MGISRPWFVCNRLYCLVAWVVDVEVFRTCFGVEWVAYRVGSKYVEILHQTVSKLIENKEHCVQILW